MDRSQKERYILNRITQLRLEKGISEKQMSRDIGKNSSYLASMIKSKNLPSTGALIDICEYLEIPLKDFFDTEYEHPVTVNKIVTELKKFSEKELEMVYSLVTHINSLKK